jgi:hypothetical protein
MHVCHREYALQIIAVFINKPILVMVVLMIVIHADQMQHVLQMDAVDLIVHK